MEIHDDHNKYTSQWHHHYDGLETQGYKLVPTDCRLSYGYQVTEKISPKFASCHEFDVDTRTHETNDRS